MVGVDESFRNLTGSSLFRRRAVHFIFEVTKRKDHQLSWHGIWLLDVEESSTTEMSSGVWWMVFFRRLVRRNGSVVDKDACEGDLEKNWGKNDEKAGENSAKNSGYCSNFQQGSVFFIPVAGYATQPMAEVLIHSFQLPPKLRRGFFWLVDLLGWVVFILLYAYTVSYMICFVFCPIMDHHLGSFPTNCGGRIETLEFKPTSNDINDIKKYWKRKAISKCLGPPTERSA